MTNISKSPERHTFQQEGYVRRCEEKGEDPNPDYIDMYKSWRQQDEENMIDPNWQKDNMEYDLRITEWILEKVRGDDVYAQNLYAAMCNNDFTKREMWPILKEQKWSCSWRHAGGVIADMREEGDYMDWYCSGIRNHEELTPEEFTALTLEEQLFRKKIDAYVSESVVTEEIKDDLYKLGWLVNEDKDDML
jgi:hypothetical protein